MKHPKLWISITLVVAITWGLIEFYSRGPDFEVLWSRNVPSFLPREKLSAAIKDTQQWPVFHHELKEASLFRVADGVETPVKETTSIEQGMRATLRMEPKGKEWKRYELRAEIIAVKPGESVSFRLLPESRGKMTKILGDYQWSFSIADAPEGLKTKGYLSSVEGESSARTLTPRARFFGRVAAKILMNQTYPIDLARLANFEENKEAHEGDYAPVYK